MFKRVFLFIGTNLLIITTISIVINLLGIKPYLSQHGIDYKSLAIFCGIWGTAGAFISLFMSKTMAKVAMGVNVIDSKNLSREESFLLEIVYGLAKRLGITQKPEVGIYNSPELNAFATGPSKNNSLVAVSSGLLTNMNRDEIEAVLGHEMSHVSNGDMVTMTLVQGIVNSFSLFLSRIIAYALSTVSQQDDREGGFSYGTFYLLSMVFDVLFTILGSMLVSAYSRWREYRADFGGAKLVGKQQMIAALKRLQMTQEVEDKRAPSLAALKISHQSSWLGLFASHPPLERRIERLQAMH